MSRAFVLDNTPSAAKIEKGRVMADVVDKETAVLRAVADEISSLAPEVVNEAVIQAASNEEGRSAEIKAKKLEALKHQNELIEEERKEAELAAKVLAASKEKEKEKEKVGKDVGDDEQFSSDVAAAAAASADAETALERAEREAIRRTSAELASMMAPPESRAAEDGG